MIVSKCIFRPRPSHTHTHTHTHTHSITASDDEPD